MPGYAKQAKKNLLYLIVILTLAPEVRSQLKGHPTGMFSDMQFNSESGDVNGMEIFITYGGGEYWAQVQIAEGEPSPPRLVKVKLQGNKISFDLPEDLIHVEHHGNAEKRTPVHQDVHYEFELKGDDLVGVSPDNALSLKRSNSYWQ